MTKNVSNKKISAKSLVRNSDRKIYKLIGPDMENVGNLKSHSKKITKIINYHLPHATEIKVEKFCYGFKIRKNTVTSSQYRAAIIKIGIAIRASIPALKQWADLCNIEKKYGRNKFFRRTTSKRQMIILSGLLWGEHPFPDNP